MRVKELPDNIIQRLTDQKMVSVNFSDGSKSLSISQGGRHSFFVSMAGYMRFRGMSGNQVYKTLKTMNNLIAQPAMDKREIKAIAKGTSKYESLYKKNTTTLSDIEEKESQFLLYPYIAVGECNMMEGDPGVGKSSVLGELAACITTGKEFCGIKPSRTGKVLFFALEDNPSSVFKTRARLQSADQTQIDYVHDYLALDDEGFEYLHQAASEYELVIVDTLTASLSGADMNKAGDMSRLLTKLGKLAIHHDTAFVLVRHLRKAGSENPTYAGMGSIAITGAVRSSMIIKKCPDDPDLRYLAHNKCNGVRKGSTLMFKIEDAEGTPIGRLKWMGKSALTDDEVLMLRPDPENEFSRAKNFLIKFLSRGPVLASEVFSEAKADDISERTLNRAKSVLHITSTKGKGSKWALPE